LDWSALSTTKNLLGCPLDDATSDRKAGRSFKVEINLAGRLSTFVDTPAEVLV